MEEPGSNVVAFRPRRVAATVPHPKGLLESVYAAGDLTLGAGDVALKTAAMMLQGLGFLMIEEVLADGTPRRIGRGEARQAMDRPWRLSKPPFSGRPGVPDAGGEFERPVQT